MVKLCIINSNRHTILSHLLNNTWILEEFLILWLVFEPPLKSDRSHTCINSTQFLSTNYTYPYVDGERVHSVMTTIYRPTLLQRIHCTCIQLF